jgi:putative hydrolase of the HAD superfamily
MPEPMPALPAAALERGAIRAISFDLDETLWPVAPALERAEQALWQWLHAHAPALVERYDRAALAALREQVWREADPRTRADYGALRRRTLALALEACGDDPAKSSDAYQVFHAARQMVDPYEDADAALARIAARFPLAALSNGTAEVARTGIGRHFGFQVFAGSVGAGKPDARIFHATCERFGLAASAVLHVGDDLELDVEGARAAGLQAAWIDRDGRGARSDSGHSAAARFRNLHDFADWLLDGPR